VRELSSPPEALFSWRRVERQGRLSGQFSYMDFFSQLLGFLKIYGTPVILLWAMVETDLVFLVVGAMASTGAVHPVLGLLAGVIGALTHDSVVFWLCKNRASWVRSRQAYRKFSDSVEKLANKTGPWQLALCRPLYGTRYPTVIYWGLRDLSYPKFVSYTLVGMVPWTLLLAAIGFQLSGHIDQFDDWLKEAKNAIFSGVLALGILLYLRHRFSQKMSATSEPLSSVGPEQTEPASHQTPLSPNVQVPASTTRTEAAHPSGNSG
jgi:membrane protein DedA with SNARE-associated domain